MSEDAASEVVEARNRVEVGPFSEFRQHVVGNRQSLVETPLHEAQLGLEE